MPKTYLCQNSACPLGSRADAGRFSGGITENQAVMLSGDPDAPHGAGVCPNCGQPAKEEK